MAIDATAAPADAIVRLNPSQLPELRALLEANGLPADDCAEQAENFYGIVERGRLIAAGCRPRNISCCVRWWSPSPAAGADWHER